MKLSPGNRTPQSIRTSGALIFFLALSLYGTIISRGSGWWASEVPLGTGKVLEAFVEPGQDALSAARSLVEQGIVRGNARALARWFAFLGMDKRLQPGVYKVRAGTPWEVAKQMERQEPDSMGIRLLPGTTAREVAKSLEKVGGESALISALSDISNFPPRVRAFLPGNPEYRIAFLLPETYRVTPSKAGAGEFVRMASSTWLKRVGPFLPPEPDPRWMLERAILASINEREARDDAERKKVAGVFVNRLERGIPLQSCATVIFAWKEAGKKLQTLTYDDLQIDSPYNTYRKRGLPPGPIGTPSFPAWEAALSPEKHDFLFFVLSESGRHHFSKTYEEHLAAQNETTSIDRTQGTIERKEE